MTQLSKLNYTIKIFESLDSTNKKAKIEAIAGAKHKSVYVAKVQSDAHGRLGRSFISNDPDGLYFSILLRQSTNPETITLHTALCVCNAVKKLSKCKNITIKWPNDILINNKKICGILTESQLNKNKIEFIVIGIGLNLNNEFIDKSISHKATSVYLETRKKISHNKILNLILRNLDKKFSLDKYKKNCISIGCKVYIKHNHEILTGIASNIAPNGNLVVNTDDGNQILINSCHEIIQEGLCKEQFN